jgi:predicted ArsR family transcriptional regulator
MTEVCRSAGLAPPDLEEISTRFRVTLHTKRTGSRVVDPVDEAILRALGSGKGLSTREIAEAIDRSPRAARTRLASLVDRGFVREVGTGPQDPKRRYFRSETV